MRSLYHRGALCSCIRANKLLRFRLFKTLCNDSSYHFICIQLLRTTLMGHQQGPRHWQIMHLSKN